MSRKDQFEATLAGKHPPPNLPRLRSDVASESLQAFREREGHHVRRQRLLELWKCLPPPTPASSSSSSTDPEHPHLQYIRELHGSHSISWSKFKHYALQKEAELWSIFHDEFDLDGDGHLNSRELSAALHRAAIDISPESLQDFFSTLNSDPKHPHAITFSEFRDFLLLLPRKVDAAEIYRYYQALKYLGDDGRGPARVTMEGDVTLSAEDTPPSYPVVIEIEEQEIEEDEEFEEDDDDEPTLISLETDTALKFLAAGGIAGAVSRTCTAPFDRLKIFLIIRPPDLGGPTPSSTSHSIGARTIVNAIIRIYAEGGVLAFWTGNMLSVAKIFPESAIKFFSYETSKRLFARHWDEVDDPRDISGTSRFLSGGIGGITSQLSIYPIETLKTQMMSHTGDQKKSLIGAIRHLWHLGGYHAFYRGLGIGLLGVFPYSAIDMSTFEALKLAYLRSTQTEEPGILALLAFGSVSGSVGATSVYPLNLVRTRLQASGSSGHPQVYSGAWDVVRKTWERDGPRGFYRGLMPTLAKVVPAVSISYLVYEQSKRNLGV